MALALGAALFLATPAQTPVAAGTTPNLQSGTESGLVSGPDLSISAATAGRAAPGDSQMRLELIAAAEAGDAGAQYRLAVDHFLGTHPRASDGREKIPHVGLHKIGPDPFAGFAVLAEDEQLVGMVNGRVAGLVLGMRSGARKDGLCRRPRQQDQQPGRNPARDPAMAVRNSLPHPASLAAGRLRKG